MDVQRASWKRMVGIPGPFASVWRRVEGSIVRGTPSKMRRPALVLIVVMLAALPAAAADDPAPAPTAGCTSGRILSPSCHTIEAYGSYVVEAWNFNGRRKTTLPGVAMVLSAARGNGWGMALEILETSVKQTPPEAFVSGMSVMLRRRVVDYRAVEVFAEGGVGASYSTAIVPERGTRFNYLVQAGLGVATHLGPHVGTIVAARWFHLSNASLNGPSHNPDIEALGGRIGLFVTF
jgi:hypothetical protein